MMTNRNALLSVLAFIAVAAVAVLVWLNQGYGEVSPQTYQYSKALYSACQAKNESHLQKIQEMLQSSPEDALSDTERGWLEAILSQALEGQWEGAARKARRMMEDQVKY